MKKYPRTFHFQFSPGKTNDDKVIHLKHLGKLLAEDVIITEKLDGSNACLKGHQGVFSRSHQIETKEPWFDFLKQTYYSIFQDLNPDYWIFGENLYAIHSIEYNDLSDHFYVFGIYDNSRNVWLNWSETEIESKRLGLETVPVLYKGRISNMGSLNKWMDTMIHSPSAFDGKCEGFVTRLEREIPENEFNNSVVKYVRKNHVQTDEHWTRKWKKQNIKGSK